MNCCRTCMSTTSLNPIFQHIDKNQKYTDILAMSTGLKILINDSLPQVLCTECVNFINKYQDFRETCLKTHRILIKCIKNIKKSLKTENDRTTIFIDSVEVENDEKNYFDTKTDHFDYGEEIEKLNSKKMTDYQLSIDDQLKEKKDIALNNPNRKPSKDTAEVTNDVTNNFDLNNENFEFEGEIQKVNNNKRMEFDMSIDDLLKEEVDNALRNPKRHRNVSKCKDIKIIRHIESRNVEKIDKVERLEKAERKDQEKRIDEVEERKDPVKIKGEVEKIEELEGRGVVKCAYCHKEFKSILSLKVHQKTHTGRNIVCEHCGMTFLSKRRLLMHCRAKHGYEKTDKCSFCDYKASNAEQVKIHERVHTGEKPYVCQECGAGFHRCSTYIQHVPMHLTEKTVQCDECPSLFKSVTLMKIHKNQHKTKRKRVKTGSGAL